MLSSLVLSSALLRTQRVALPRTFNRYKSITAAIEKGRGSGPDRFSAARGGSRTRSRNDEVTSSRYDRSEAGGARPSRSKSSLGARRRRWEDEDVAPRRKEIRRSGARPDDSAGDRRMRRQDRETPRRFDDRSEWPDRFVGRSGGRDARSGRREAPRRSHEDSEHGDRPQRRPERTFNRDDRPPRRAERSFDRDERPPRRTERDDRPSRRTERPFDRDDRRSPRNDRDTRTSESPRDRAPDSLPYTTAASEFIYGYSSVLAAIRASRRQFYKLYVNSRGLNRDMLLARAKASNLRHITREVGDSYDRAFDKASSGRPHNGFILEASPLPVQPITELQECSKETASFTVTLAPQTKEELAVNGTRTSFPFSSSSRYPLLLYLDGVLDEGNLGAIARSAYFLGVDAIITPTRQSAPWSHIAVKASAGAAEAIPLFKVSEPAEFLGKASRNGWRCYAADAIPADPTTKNKNESKNEDQATEIVYTLPRSTKRLENHSPVAEHPTILMLGAEGTGLKSSLLNLAHYKVGIRQGRAVDEVGVDSLNVSVAAGMLCLDMLRKRGVVERDPENVVF